MAKKKRSELFYDSKTPQKRQIRKEDRTSSEDNSRREKVLNKRQVNRRRKRSLRIKNPLRFGLISVIIVLFLSVFLYEIYAENSTRTINRAVESIKDSNFKAQDKYFDKLGEINQVLRDSYSKDQKEAEEFLAANYKNLDVEVKDKEKTDKGLKVTVEVKNVNYIDVFDKIAKKDDDNLHQNYIKALEDEDQKKVVKSADLLLVRKFGGYEIYESRDFVDAILGGALEHTDDEQK